MIVNDTGSDILLVHPLGLDAASAKRNVARLANLMPPLGLASLAAYVESLGHRAEIIDCFAHPDAATEVLQYVRRHRPPFVGASCTTAGFPSAEALLREVKEINPDTTTVGGGPHISAMGAEILRRSDAVDVTVVGEGERPLGRLLSNGLSGAEPIPGLVFRGSDGIVENPPERPGVDLDSLPLPAYEKLHGFPGFYQLPIFNYPAAPNTSCNSSRGCPYQCSYCDRSVFGRSFRFNSAEYLYNHLELLARRFGIRHVNFYDDQFTFHQGRVEAFCRMMIDKPLRMTFNCAVRAEHVTPELLRLMKRAGCWMISLGIETGDPDLLARHRQHSDLDVTTRAIHDIHRAGIRVKGLFMIGLPGETEASFRRTMDYIFSVPIDDFNVSRFTPFPGSPLYEKIHEYGRFEEDWSRMDCMHSQFIPHGLTAEQIEQLFRELYRRHFSRPKVLADYVSMLWRSPHSWRRFLGSLGGFLRYAVTGRQE